jgi:glycosyltransferase involved in cell wall biosynthesis
VRIAFVIPSLGPGGAERVATLLASYWVGEGHEVVIATFDAPEVEPFFAVDPRVEVRGLSAKNATRGLAVRLGTNAARLARLRALLRKVRPDAVVAFMTEANVVAIWAARGLGIPVVVSERNQPDRPGLGPFHKLARRLTYPAATALVVQSKDIAAWAKAHFRIPVHILPNPVMPPANSSSHNPGGGHLLVSIGRLTHQKGFDVLLQSFAAIAAKYPDWRLAIYGEGPDRPALERLRLESGCAGQIDLPGLTKDSAETLHQASLFVLPSRFEGYPNVLLEALSQALPVIATDCPGATREILADGVHGMLVPPEDIAAMTAALDAMLSAIELRETYAAKARRAVAQLDVATIGRRWLDVLAGLRADEA